MTSLLDRLAEPFEPLAADTAAAALAEHWGIDATILTRLETERDDTFRVEAPSGLVAIKFAHPSDAPAVIDLQCAVLDHVAAADPGIPLSRLVRTRGGERTAVVDGRIARVLTWLDGELLNDVPRTEPLMTDAGRMLGRLSRALADLEHPASDRESAWDLPHLPDLRPHTDDPVLLDVIDRFEAEVVPRLGQLPWQIVHNDFHPGNVLTRDGRISGVLDVGDTARTPRVADLAIALTYLVPDAPRPWPHVDAFVTGFESAVPLLPEEREVLPMLIAARTVARNVINGVMNADAADELEPFYAANRRRLARILEA